MKKIMRVTVSALALSLSLAFAACNSQQGEQVKKVANEVAQLSDTAKQKALALAERYLRSIPYSKDKLLQKLKSPTMGNLSEAEAEYAVSNVQVDWKETAYRKALRYKEDAKASYEQITKDLAEKDLFKPEEVSYAVETLKAKFEARDAEEAASSEPTSEESTTAATTTEATK